MCLPARRSCTRPGALELRQVRRNARLPHVQDFLDFGHRQLRLFQQQQQPQTRRVRQETQGFDDG